MVGAYKARVAPFNVNYRYVDDELIYLLNDAEAARARLPRALRAERRSASATSCRSSSVLHPGRGRLGQRAAARRGRLRRRRWRSRPPARPALTWSPDDLYILYTGGTTGMPKGVLWRQEDIFFGALGGHPMGGQKFASVEARRRGGAQRRPARLPGAAVHARRRALDGVHGAAPGGTIVIQQQPERLDPDDIWSTVERERVRFLTIVGDAFGRPLIDQLDQQAVRPVAASASSSPAARS